MKFGSNAKELVSQLVIDVVGRQISKVYLYLPMFVYVEEEFTYGN